MIQHIFMRSSLSKIVFLCFLISIFIFLFFQLKSISKGYSDFATPDELIIRNQILSMSWQKLNGPFGGQGYTIRFFQNNPNKIVVTDSNAGIHISNDRGLTWIESVEGIDSRTGKSGDAVPVFVTTIDPNNPDRIWCGVKNAMGVFLSTDGGMSWQHKDNGLPSGSEVEIRGLAVKPGDSNTIFACGDLEEIAPLMGGFQRTQGILYRTIDGGENWTKVLDGGNLFKDVIIDPKNTNNVYVASGFFDRHQLTKLEGVYKSTDGGSTWTQINSGIRNLYITNIKFDPKDSNTIWGTTGMIRQFGNDFENEDGSIIVTKDGGMSWAEAKRGRTSGATQIYSALGISPTNPNIIYASGFGVFVKSADGGMSWTETGFGPLGSNAGHAIDIAVSPTDENTVLVDSYIGGVFKSTDGGNTWVTNAFGYSGAETQGVAISPDGQSVFATSRVGIFLSKDKGANWLPVGLGDIGLDELQAIAPHPTDKNKILLGDSQNAMSSIFLSTDGGMIWKTVFMVSGVDLLNSSSLDLTGEVVFTDIIWSKSNPQVAFASCVKQSLAHDFVDSIGWGTFKSTDGGMTWINKQNGIPGFKNTWSIDVDPNNENIVYAATNDSGIVKSIDGGENWVQINNGFGDVTSFHSVSIYPANTMVILAGSADGQIFRTDNSGESWTLVSSDLRTDDNIVSIVFNPIATTHQVYAAGNATGFYVSGDDGQSWQPFNNGLLIREITGLAVTPDGFAVYGATNGGGIFRLPISGDALTLTRKQIETPSNAGIDASNNTNPNDIPTSSSSSTGGTTSTSSGGSANLVFSLSISGPALNGIKLLEKRAVMSLLNVGFDQSTFDQGIFSPLLENTKISITTDLPRNAIMISPQNFILMNKDSIQNVVITIKSLNKLKKIKKIEGIGLTITQTSEGMLFSRDVEIPIIIE